MSLQTLEDSIVLRATPAFLAETWGKLPFNSLQSLYELGSVYLAVYRGLRPLLGFGGVMSYLLRF